MSEALQKQTNAAGHAPLSDPISGALAIEVPVEVNDNDVIVAPREGERRTFELPSSVWKLMITSYGIFLVALLSATGGGHAGFAIAISTVFMIMYFGTAKAIMLQAPPQTSSVLERSGSVLQTAYGPLARHEVFGQILIVPIGIAMFGVAIAVICALVT